MNKSMNTHVGDVLDEMFLKPMNITAYRLSKSIGVQQTRISQIIKGNTSVTADMATRLAKYFGTSPQLWLNLQNLHDIRKIQEEKSEMLAQIIPLELAS
ncbi:MAG: HigA family addiction module antitoxin [Cyclobacteriaceae bacterium]|nr:HigA family addiction module antitoxin [Cyclobacteriaceae bacterium]